MICFDRIFAKDMYLFIFQNHINLVKNKTKTKQNYLENYLDLELTHAKCDILRAYL